MSFFDFRFKKNPASAWDGMQPPELTWGTLLADYRWHRALYRTNGLPWRVRLAFHFFRIVQLTAYAKGWKKGSSYARKNSA